MIKRFGFLTIATILLSSCAGFFDKDNTQEPAPLTNFTAEVKPHLLWSTKVGSGNNNEYLRLSPALSGNAIYTASAKGVVTAINKLDGQTFWAIDTRMPITSGPGVGDDIVVIGSRRGEVIALQQSTGRLQWRQTVAGEILANPAIGHNTVIIKATDGTLTALAVNDGHLLWSFKQTEPSLILRGSSNPVIRDNSLFAGFAKGTLVKLSLRGGEADWIQPIATPQGGFSIERMIDIDADPILYGHRVYAATYQGKIASLDWNSGSTLWSHDISSYTGMTADENTLYISDANSYLWSFGASNGLEHWRQTQLEARNISAPAAMGNYIVVGDSEGYLHWLSKNDGHLAAREFAGNAIMATPIVENNVLYVLTNNGSLVAYTLS